MLYYGCSGSLIFTTIDIITSCNTTKKNVTFVLWQPITESKILTQNLTSWFDYFSLTLSVQAISSIAATTTPTPTASRVATAPPAAGTVATASRSRRRRGPKEPWCSTPGSHTSAAPFPTARCSGRSASSCRRHSSCEAPPPWPRPGSCRTSPLSSWRAFWPTLLQLTPTGGWHFIH